MSTPRPVHQCLLCKITTVLRRSWVMCHLVSWTFNTDTFPSRQVSSLLFEGKVRKARAQVPSPKRVSFCDKVEVWVFQVVGCVKPRDWVTSLRSFFHCRQTQVILKMWSCHWWSPFSTHLTKLSMCMSTASVVPIVRDGLMHLDATFDVVCVCVAVSVTAGGGETGSPFPKPLDCLFSSGKFMEEEGLHFRPSSSQCGCFRAVWAVFQVKYQVAVLQSSGICRNGHVPTFPLWDFRARVVVVCTTGLWVDPEHLWPWQRLLNHRCMPSLKKKSRKLRRWWCCSVSWYRFWMKAVWELFFPFTSSSRDTSGVSPGKGGR